MTVRVRNCGHTLDEHGDALVVARGRCVSCGSSPESEISPARGCAACVTVGWRQTSRSRQGRPLLVCPECIEEGGEVVERWLGTDPPALRRLAERGQG